MATEEEIGRAVIGAALKVHSALGPGLLESVYERCLGYELALRGLRVQRQEPVEVRYADLNIENAYRIDLLAENRVVLELKAVETIHPVHKYQLLSYLKLGKYKLGYLLNFNTPHMRDGITRVVNGL